MPVDEYVNFPSFPAPNTQIGRFGYDLALNDIYVSENGAWRKINGGGGSALPAGAAGQFLRLDVDGVTPIWVTLTQDMIAAAFSVTLALTSHSTVQEVGASIINPQFTDTHNQTPSAASLQDFLGTQAIIPATLLALGYGGAANTFAARTYAYPGSLNSTRVWTYSATAAALVRTASVTVTWEPKVYWDVLVLPGALNAAFITGMANSALAPSVVRNINYADGTGTKYLWYAVPSAFAAPTSFLDNATQLSVPTSRVASNIAVTNVNGIVINYDIYRSDFQQSGAFTEKVS
jgi:hypothetical protein